MDRLQNRHYSRRQFLTHSGLAVLAGGLQRSPCPGAQAERATPKRVAAVVTIYIRNSHTDVLVGKILEGWKQDGGPGPNLELVSMYVDQFPGGDLSREMAQRHNFPVTDTIEEALTLGGDKLDVDGVLLIGEHGDYPWNEKGQHLYPRRRFMEQVTDVFEKRDEVVPIFHDKHFGPQWEDALWMFERAQSLSIPLMAGSSLPVSFRSPDRTIPMGSHVQRCVAIGYSGLDIYGFHTLEFLQCLLERRRGAEQGVAWVHCLPGKRLPELISTGVVPERELQATLAVTPTAGGQLSDADPAGFTIFLVGYRDGLTVPVLMLEGYARGIAAGWTLAGETSPQACLTEERVEPRFPHFAYLLKGIEKMFHTGVPAYPAERTLLTAGTLDRLLTSRHEGHHRRETPELALAYEPVDYGYAPHL